MHPINGWPSDPGHRALLPFSKPQRRCRYRSPARRAGAILRPQRTRPLPHHRVDPGPHAGGEHNGRRRPATTCSGSTLALGAAGRVRRQRSSSASARHAPVSATTRSPCSSNSPSWHFVLGQLAATRRLRSSCSATQSAGSMGFDPLPETKAVRAPNRLAGSGTHRQECLTRRESAAIHDYPRATGPSHRFAKALLIERFSPELSPRSWWIAPRRSGVRVPLIRRGT